MHSVNCIMCGRKLTLLKTKVKDGFICGGCIGRLPINVYEDRMNHTGAEMLKIARDFESRSDTYRNGHYQDTTVKNKNTGSKFNPSHSEEWDEFTLIRVYKKLFEEGVITEEEYEKKKKEFLED